MARQFDIVVVGGGLVGAAAAGLFAGDGFEVAVVERGRGGSGGDGAGDGAGGADDGADSRVSAINLAAAALFKHLDAWPPGDATVCAYRAMKVWDRNTSAKIAFRAADLGRDRLGSIVENRVLVAALREKLRAHARVAWLDDTEITAIDARGAALRVELSGETLETQLLVGADGANSKVRELAGIATARRDFEQDAITATVAIAAEAGHRHTAWQCFLDTGPAALLPLADGRCALVWSCARGLADELMALSAEDFCARLQAGFAGGGGGGGQFGDKFCDKFGRFSGEFGDKFDDQRGDETGGDFGSQLGAITDCGPRRRFPLVQHHADSYLAASAPVALIGDAAHAIHPLAGLGANIGLVDAAALAEVVSQARARGAAPGKYATLRRYERWRRGDNAAVVAVMAGFHDLFRNRAPAAKIARAAGFNCADRSPPLKAALANFATGLCGDLPTVCRGV
ncbi:MAG: FAD-dependent monooxygenase [Gammaproteobacteria bacterium]|nr:FAD-dependent monooxygenase [Gammaproteobacteria bacterium]